MSNYTLYTGGNDFKQVNGNSITASSTKVLGGASKGLGSNVTLLDNVGHGVQLGIFSSQLIKGVDLGTAFWGASVTGTVGDNGSTLCRYHRVAHGYVVDDILNVVDANATIDSGSISGPQKVTTVVGADDFDTDKAFVTGTGSISFRKSQGNINFMTAGKYVMRRVTDELAGVANTNLRSGGVSPSFRRSIHKVESIYTRKVATAIRAGKWNIYSGTYSSPQPTNAEEGIANIAGSTVTDGTADHAATPTRAIPGELVYKEPKLTPVQDDYKAITGK